MPLRASDPEAPLRVGKVVDRHTLQAVHECLREQRSLAWLPQGCRAGRRAEIDRSGAFILAKQLSWQPKTVAGNLRCERLGLDEAGVHEEELGPRQIRPGHAAMDASDVDRIVHHQVIGCEIL
jgi:hypothetical protein